MYIFADFIIWSKLKIWLHAMKNLDARKFQLCYICWCIEQLLLRRVKVRSKPEAATSRTGNCILYLMVERNRRHDVQPLYHRHSQSIRPDNPFNGDSNYWSWQVDHFLHDVEIFSLVSLVFCSRTRSHTLACMRARICMVHCTIVQRGIERERKERNMQNA